jgi:hypothetical protein
MFSEDSFQVYSMMNLLPDWIQDNLWLHQSLPVMPNTKAGKFRMFFFPEMKN